MHKALSLAIRLENTNKRLYGGTNPDLIEAAALFREIAASTEMIGLLELTLKLRFENEWMLAKLKRAGMTPDFPEYGSGKRLMNDDILGRKAA